MNVAPDPRPLICLECGAANRPDAFVCKTCRTPLHSGSGRPPRRPPSGRRERPRLFWAYFVFALATITGLALGTANLAGVNPVLLVVCSIVILSVVLASTLLAATWADRPRTTSTAPWVRRFLMSLLITIPATFALLAGLALAMFALLFAICSVSRF